MIVPFIIILALIVLFLIKKSKYSILYNELFWLTLYWTIIIGVYILSNINWDYPVTFITWTYIAICFLSFVIFRSIGLKQQSNRTAKIHTINAKIDKRVYILLGLLGAAVNVFEYIRLNGIQKNEKIAFSTSFLGVLGNLFVPILLVMGLYLFSESYVLKKKISIVGLICLIIYIIPCIINAGRESILYVILAIIPILSYSKWLDIKNQKITIKKKKSLFSKFIIIGGIVALTSIIIIISNNRFTTEVSNYYLNALNVPYSIREEAKMFGKAENLYGNFLYYTCHELSGLEMVLRFYDGPYMFGLFELNIISRRFPSSWGVDYNLALVEINNILSMSRDYAILRYGWRTMLTSLIVDFGKWLTPLVCGILGFCTGCIRKRFIEDNSIQNLVLISLLCFSMFTTIQLGPFFSFSVYGSYIWWYIIFKLVFPKINQSQEDN